MEGKPSRRDETTHPNTQSGKIMRPQSVALAIGLLLGKSGFGQTATTNSLIIHADAGSSTISRMIYGQFSEHLGRCIYEGIWVGSDSPIPNTRGIRNDVVAALKKMRLA